MRLINSAGVIIRLMLIGIFIPFFSFGQELSIWDFINSKPEEMKSEEFVVFHHRDYYSFEFSSGVLSAHLEATRDIVPMNERAITYYDFTDSFSSIKSVKGQFANGRSALYKTGVNHFTQQYESDGIFHNDFYINSMKMTDPTSGFYSLEYSKIYSDYKFLATLPFFSSYPTVNSTLTIEIPNNLEIDIVKRNFENYIISEEEEILRKSKKITFRLEGNKSLEACSYCPSANHYQPHLILIYKSIQSKRDTTELLPDVKSLYDWYQKVVSEVPNRPKEINELVKQFEEVPKGEEQLTAVYDWIRSNVRYIAFEAGMAGFRPDDCQSVYKKRYGDCKGMANLGKHVLTELGYDARLAWIGTRGDVPYDYSIPSLAVDNHMITAVNMDGELIYIDPTEKYGHFDEYAFRIQGRPVMIENGDEFILENVPESSVDSDRVRSNCTFTFDPAEKLAFFSGDISMKGESRKYILYNFDYTKAQDRNDALKAYLRPYDTGGFNLISQEGFLRGSDSLYFQYELSTPSAFIDLGSEFYLDIDPSDDLEFIEIEENRVADYFFRERFNRETNVTAMIPEGYAVTYQPESFAYSTDQFELSVQFKLENNVLRLEKRIVIYDGTVSGENKTEFETALNHLLEYYQDRVIITRL